MADGEEQGQEGGGPNVPAGWYPDPNTGGQRYWDGTQWTEYTDQNYPGQAATGPATPATGAPARPAGATNQKAVWSLVTGILSILCCVFFFGVLALGLGGTAVFLSRSAKREMAATGQVGDGMATAGMICGIAGIVLGVIGLVLGIVFFASGEFDIFFDLDNFEDFDNFDS